MCTTIIVVKLASFLSILPVSHWECLKWPSFFFNYTLMLIYCGIHSADICINTTISHWWLPCMVLSTWGSGQLSARSTIHSKAVWIYLYLLICLSLFILYISLSPYFIIWVCGLVISLSFHLFIFIYIVCIFISIFHYMSMWFGLPCYPWQSVLLQKSACKWWENVY